MNFPNRPINEESNLNERDEKILEAVERTLHELHQYQVSRATKIARECRPELTAEDLLNPDDFAEIAADPRYMHEDGQAAGIMSAKIAVRAMLRKLFE